MKHVSQTLKVILALFVATFSNGLLPAAQASAYSMTNPDDQYKKVYVCKYVGTPGIDERLQTGDNPIDVSTNAIKDFAGIGSYFNDAQGRSYVVAWDNNDGHEPPVSMCPTPQNQTPVTPVLPDVNDVCGTENDTVTLPTTTGIIYSKTQVGLVVTVTATPETGYKIQAGNGYIVSNGVGTYTIILTNAACIPDKTPVTPESPDVYDVCGTENDKVTLPTTTGITYSMTQVGQIVTVTATAKSGYVLQAGNGYTLQENGTATYTVTLKDTPCKVFVCKYVGTPTIDERLQTGQNPISVSVNAIKDFQGIGSYFNDAQGRSYVLAYDNGQDEDTLPPCPTEAQKPTVAVTPTACSLKYESTGSATATITNTADDTHAAVSYNWQLKQGSVVIEHGTTTNVNDGASVTVSLDGIRAGDYSFVITSSDNTTASTTFTIATCPVSVTPEAPTFYDYCGVDATDYVYIPASESVIYKINDQAVSAGYHKVTTASVNVTAVVVDGNILAEGAKTSWTYIFTNVDCISISKKSLPVTDTNHDGYIGVGDVVTWEITVTNNSSNALDNFTVQVKDATATLENNGLIAHLEAGKSVTLTATSTLTVSDLQACKATNTATFTALFMQRDDALQTDAFSSLTDNERSPELSGSASAEAVFTCPTPGHGVGGETTTTTGVLPAELPATGPAETSPFLPFIAAFVAYGATYFLQKRRELMAQ